MLSCSSTQIGHWLYDRYPVLICLFSHLSHRVIPPSKSCSSCCLCEETILSAFVTVAVICFRAIPEETVSVNTHGVDARLFKEPPILGRGAI